MSPRKSSKPYSGNITTPPPSWLAPVEQESLTSSSPESLVKLSDIHLPSEQPRRYFDPQALKGLADSIQQHGLLQPLLVRPRPQGGYELVAGERRYRAATEIQLSEVPVVIKELTDETAWQLALIENLQREDLNPVEETEGILQLLAFKLEMPVQDIPPLLYRLQKAEKKRGKNKSSETIKTQDEGETNTSHNVMGQSLEGGQEISEIGREDTQAETNPSHNVMGQIMGQTQEEDPHASHNVMGQSLEEGQESSEIGIEDTQAKTNPSHNVMGNPKEMIEESVNSDLAIIQLVFDELGLMTWQSFVNNRLPLLNLPDEITEALRQGKIAYTKAIAISKVSEEKQRKALLTEAIEQELSLSQIKERIKALSPKPQSSSTEIPERLKMAYQTIKKKRLWEEPEKQQQIEVLLSQLEKLIDETSS